MRELLTENTLNTPDKTLADKRKLDVLNNSMMPTRKANKSFCDVSDDSFLEMERLCNEEKYNQSPSINETLLFDIEPPTNLWEDSSIFLPTVNNIQNQSKSVYASPAKMFGPARPSTIIEERSSQFTTENDRTEKSSNSTTNSTSSSDPPSTMSASSAQSLTSASILDTSIPVLEPSNTSTSSLEKIPNNKSLDVDKFGELPKFSSKNAAKRRETLVFKKKRYKFFKDEVDVKPSTPIINRMDSIQNENLIDLDSPAVDQSVQKNDFNDTLEAVDYFIEEGRRLLENQKTPFCDRGNQSTTPSILETPFLSCKRTRILSEMSAIEGFPIAKRGPLFDLLSPDKNDSPIVKKQ